MQATRTCRVTAGSSSTTAVFNVSQSDTKPAERSSEKEDTKEEQQNESADTKPEEEVPKPETPKPKDPIRMFGILVPQALRSAQADGIKMVEALIPKLVAVDAEMKAVEIEIRRKRKYRAKAEAAESKNTSSVEALEKASVVECES